MDERRHAFEGEVDEMPCTVCGEAYDVMDLDRLLWCERCRMNGRNMAGWWGWVIGLVFGAVVAGYIFLGIRPSDFVIGGWIATVVAAMWIGSKVGREIAYGVMRSRRGRDSEPTSA